MSQKYSNNSTLIFRFQWLKCNIDNNFAKFRQILMSRYEDIVVSFHCLLKVNKLKQVPSHFPVTRAKLWSMRTLGHAIWQNRFLRTTYGPFYQLVLSCFLENPIGSIFIDNKDVNSGGIKYFKGRKHRDFNFSLDHLRAGKTKLKDLKKLRFLF